MGAITMSKAWAERLTAAGMIIFAVLVLIQSMQFPFTSGTFSSFTSYVIIALGIIMIARSYFSKDEKFLGKVAFNFSYFGMKPVYVMLVGAIYSWSVFTVGFYAASLVFFVLVTIMTGYRNAKVIAAVAVVLFPLMYVFFSIGLDANLPEGFLI